MQNYWFESLPESCLRQIQKNAKASIIESQSVIRHSLKISSLKRN